jgi:hypothetical protein
MTKAQAEHLSNETFKTVFMDLSNDDPDCAIMCTDETIWMLLEHGYWFIAWRLIDDVNFELNKYFSVQWGMD